MAERTNVLGQQRGSTPEGEVLPIPVSGQAAVFTGLLAAGETKSFVMNHQGYSGVAYIIKSDVPSASGGITIDFSDDNATWFPAGIGITYDQLNVQIQRGLMPKGKWMRFNYKNGAQAQTSFRLELVFSVGNLQPTLTSVNLPTTATNFATVTKSINEQPDESGVYAVIGRDGDAMKVVVTNEADNSDAAKSSDIQALLARLNQQLSVNTVDVSGLQTTLTSILSRLNAPLSTEISNDTGNPLPISGSVSVSNLPATQPVSGSVSVSNLPATQPISAASLPLPAGAATSARQDTLNTAIGNPNDPIITDATQSASLISIMKGLLQEGLSQPTAGTAQTVNLSANVAQTIAANSNGKGRLIFSTNGTVLIGFGFTATATLYSVRIVTNGFYEVPPLWSNLSISLFSTSASSVNVTTLV